MSLNLNTIRAVVLDMDGVLWRGADVFSSVAPFFSFVADHDIKFALATNNSTKTVASYVQRLNSIGVPAEPYQVITSSVATADYERRRYPVDTPVYVVGEDGIRQGMADLGYREDSRQAQLVVVGMDFNITYDKLKTATLRIRAGADFIGTNGDTTFPFPEGLGPGNGALLALIESATDVVPTVIGKPETAMFEVALDRLGTSADETLMIGDRLETDILGAQRAGLPTALVLTGITTPDMARESNIQADEAYDSLAALHAAWAQLFGDT
jgi:4-nitrophenyl phosphatase